MFNGFKYVITIKLFLLISALLLIGKILQIILHILEKVTHIKVVTKKL